MNITRIIVVLVFVTLASGCVPALSSRNVASADEAPTTRLEQPDFRNTQAPTVFAYQAPQREEHHTSATAITAIVVGSTVGAVLMGCLVAGAVVLSSSMRVGSVGFNNGFGPGL